MAGSRLPCPCCGHLTLPSGPGDYEDCPVCRWEDESVSLRWPMRHQGGPNAESLQEAQQERRRFRDARADEPLDPGWRPFDPEVDWTHPMLESERWPADLTTLYYWRDTYWHGDATRGAAPPREPTSSDRLVDHLRASVPEARPVIDALEWQYGEARAHRVCSLLAAPARAAFRDGDRDTGLRIVRGVAVGLDEDGDAYAPNAVCIGFLEDRAWHAAGLDIALDEWPAVMRAEIESQRRSIEEHTDHAASWGPLHATASGRPVDDLLTELRALAPPYVVQGDPETELDLELTARVLSDPRWARHHPLGAMSFAWRHRSTRAPWRTLRSLVRPRFAG